MEENKTNRVARSFSDAFRGLAFAVKTEINFKIELCAGIIVVVLMLIFRITDAKALVLIMAIAAVLLTEIMNTAVERVMDVIHPEYHPYVKNVKDLMAASVLITSLAALILGLVIFIPYIWLYV